MESLPDDVIVQIFSFLPPRDLLGPVRGVCRAWRTLALQWDAWKHVSLSCYRQDKLLKRALRLAPCLHSLQVNYNCPLEMQQAMATTSCKVQTLDISNCLESCALSVLRPQVPHTKYLRLKFADGAAEILALIQDMALVELNISLSKRDTVKREMVVDRPFRNNCLKRLAIQGLSDSDLLVGSLITENATSLQEFLCWDKFMNMPLTLKALRALNCRLKLTIPVSSLKDIIGMKNLNHLTVRVFGLGHEGAVRKGLSALSGGLICATSVTFHNSVNKNALDMLDSRNVAMSVCLREMGTLGRCEHIESLVFYGFSFQATEVLTLSGLPNLRELRLRCAPLPEQWLDAIEGLKSLQLLHLESMVCINFECIVPGLRRLIDKVTGLHVIKLLDFCCQKRLSLPDSDPDKPYGLRGNCQPKCALCARYRHVIVGDWHR